MKFENLEVFGFEAALRGMRNPKNSWNKVDSYYDKNNNYIIGPNDLRLAKQLISAGPEHRKFLRQIVIWVDITAPLFWWKEADQYKVGTTTNSQSTMHKITSKPITLDCFELSDYDENLIVDKVDQSDLTEVGKEIGFIDHWHLDMFTESLINKLEDLRQMYLKTKDKRYWKELIRWLPESWLQMRTITLNYEIAYNMYRQRKNHKLIEWSGENDSMIKFLESLPYFKEFFLDLESES